MSYQRATTRFIPDSAPKDLLSQEFEIDFFQLTISRYLRANLKGVNFWDLVVFTCTKGKYHNVPLDQKLHLHDWIKDNWTWFTENFSNRERYYLTQKLLALKDTNE